MTEVSLAEAKAKLIALVDKVEAGEEILITRHGKLVARLGPVVPSRQPLPSLAAFRKTMPKSLHTTAALLRRERDESR